MASRLPSKIHDGELIKPTLTESFVIKKSKSLKCFSDTLNLIGEKRLELIKLVYEKK
ncbi:hypothetical protein DERP_011870 [Dermatophagoides pteronyssinus]|uniref:Uncharacterized protein n=1 Tax=Dermatophagoides pteronyssinus TaxID=6956 RepID=A0ABQ8JRV7_DERPT|nr:hypothetical protein DERP_011870 [Dermatophagoides pteronyssinus]